MIKTFEVKKYRGCPIYFRLVGTSIWEYFTIIDKELYTAHYDITAAWWRRIIFHFNKDFEKLFTEQQKQICLKLLKAGAETTIDTINQKKQDGGNKTKR